jgi:hypothetical protein
MSRYTEPTPTTFAEALAILESGRTQPSREARKIGNNTTLERIDADRIGVRLHSTYVVLFHRSGAVSLNSGGWRSVITKERINRYLAPGLGLFQERGLWYVQDRRPEFADAADRGPDGDRWAKRYRVEYTDGLLILPDASLHGRERVTSAAE